jgi:hypothetical protein
VLVSDPYRQARELLPNMPEEIFRLWFNGRIKANGWPPVSDTWKSALRDRPISYWKRLNWKKEILSLDFQSLTAPAQRIVNGLIDANYYGIQNEYSEIGNSRVRMHRILDYIWESRTLPGTLILLRENESLEIVDGSHRLSVFFSLKSQDLGPELLSKEQEVWVGEL